MLDKMGVEYDFGYDKEINEKTKEYRKMQDEYGARITSGVKSKKASS